MVILRSVLVVLAVVCCLPVMVLAQNAEPQSDEARPEVVVSPQEYSDSEPQAEELPALVISNVAVETQGGEYSIRWSTNRPAAGALTYVSERGGESVQHRLTDGQFSTQHHYVIYGFEGAGVRPLLLEAVDFQMSYARKVVSLHATPRPNQEARSALETAILYGALFSLLAVALLSIEFWYLKQNLQDRMVHLEKNSPPATSKTRTRQRATTRKTTTRKRVTKNKPA